MEGDAGAVPVSPDPDEDQQSAGTEADDAAAAAEPDESAAAAAAEHDEQAEATDSNPSRLGHRQLLGICALLVLLAAGLVGAGYLGLRDHAASQVMARDNAEALEAAKSCVLATQAPDPGNVSLSQQKMLDCSAGEFRTQAALYAQILPPAYQAAKVQVELTEMGAAVERNNPDGSIDILVAFRIKVDNIEAKGREAGYRLRAQMVREDGQYRIGKLDQVAR
ncbi:Mce protein [[Mycobacterium] crassicus]|uniref:Mce protein n=1 Tax=[Mycobacterium] crassicus TaxID=2872309 RepID=A0ABU5XD24_9MYCO|nr:Mce protein [Mycolicibacter sp. MYC098]MEB3020200.1 Mce protein [Mycolicibacter sp. MYC098]